MITIYCEPFGKQRPRFQMRGGYPHAYTPRETVDYEKYIRDEYIRQGGMKYDGAISVNLCFYMPVPKSWSNKRKQMALDGAIHPTAKPDIDNLAKAILDALNGVAFEDDSQIVYFNSLKIYSDTPAVSIKIDNRSIRVIRDSAGEES